MPKVHIFGEYYIIENNQNISTYLSEVQFKILNLHTQGFLAHEIFKILIGDEQYDEESSHQASKNIQLLINQLSDVDSLFLDDIIFTGEYGRYYPMILNLELTNQCNFKCSHCYKDAGMENLDFLDEKIIREIIRLYSGKIKTIHLTGGEPLIYPNVNDLIIQLTNHFNVNVTTNGSLLHKLNDETIKSINNIQISLYGFDENSYETIAKNKKGFYEVEKSLVRLDNLNIKYDVSITANEIFIKNYQKYLLLLSSPNINRLLIGLPYLEGRAKNNKDIWTLTQQDLDKLYLIEDKLGLHQKTHIITDEFKLNINGKEPFDMCGAGSIMYTVNEKGDLLFCTSLNKLIKPIGNINDIEIRSNKQPIDFKQIIQETKFNNTFHTPMCPLLGE